jgi:hypothetical protein
VDERLVRIESNIQETVTSVATDHRGIPTLKGEGAWSDMDSNALGLIQRLVDDTICKQ